MNEENCRTLVLKDKFQCCLIGEKFETIDVGINRKNLNFAILKLRNNSFDYEKMYQYLTEAAVYYALPKKRIKELMDSGKIASIVKETQQKFRNSNYNEGEGGELILYCINEDILNAPKILSKLKLKTNNNDYVKGADGIHFLKNSDGSYEIILCESKMYQNIEDAVDKAFNSIDRFIDDKSLDFEITTLATNLDGEFEQIDVDYIKNYIIPSKGEVRTNDAFSIFIGFQVDSQLDKSLPHKEYEENLKKELIKYIEEKKQKIIKKLSEEKRLAYTFYVYLIPFFGIEEVRHKIIYNIKKGEKND